MSESVLLVIDIQVGNVTGDESAWESDRLLRVIGGLVDEARAAGTPVVHVQHRGGAGDPDEPGTPGFLIHPRIAPQVQSPRKVLVRILRSQFGHVNLGEQSIKGGFVLLKLRLDAGANLWGKVGASTATAPFADIVTPEGLRRQQ